VVDRAVEAMLGPASAILSVISHPRLALSSTAIGVAVSVARQLALAMFGAAGVAAREQPRRDHRRRARHALARVRRGLRAALAVAAELGHGVGGGPQRRGIGSPARRCRNFRA
jgi:hypothetical protein